MLRTRLTLTLARSFVASSRTTLMAMPRAPRTILEAGLSYRDGWENRLTAVFASVLDLHYRFASALFELLELPPGERYESYTEVWVTPNRRVDMQVVAMNASHGHIAQIWSEHKRHGGAFGTGQREDYLRALERQGGGRLVTITPDLREDPDSHHARPRTKRAALHDEELALRSGEASPGESRWWGLDWQLVAELAYGVGETESDGWGGRNWRDRALRPDAPASHRALYELVWYLEQEGYAVVSPLSAQHVQALKHVPDMVLAARAVLKRATDEMTSLIPDGDVEDYDDGGFGQSFVVPPTSWVHRLDGSAELIVYHDDGWVDEPRGEPSVAAGVSLDADWYRPLNRQTEWAGRVHAAGFSLVEYEGYVVMYATRPLDDVVAHGTNLAEQAQFVATWAGPQIERLLSDEFEPGGVERPPKPQRARRRT
jgi:hypothetical protein